MKIPIAISLCFSLLACTPSLDQPQQQPPNIVFLFADDFTYEAIHALGNELIHTPNLDRLINSGVSFTHAYNMGGWHGAICVASRSMIISGASLWKSQDVAKQWASGDARALENTWGRLMQTSGYQTYMSGKWHVDASPSDVFNTVRHIRPGMPDDYWVTDNSVWQRVRETYQNGGDLNQVLPLGYGRPREVNDTLWSPSDTTHGGYWQGGKHWSEVLKDDALDFIDMATQQSKPFFMYLAFNAPHDPRQAPAAYLDLYPLEEIPLPENWLDEYPYKDSIGNTPSLRDEALAPYPRTPLAIKTHIKEYYAIISHLDAQIGIILDSLESAGLLENTYIFFTGDHGLSVGHHGLLGKQNLYDHSIRVPLLVKGPNIPSGHRIEAPVYLQDIMATSLALGGIEKPDHVFFKSFLDLARGLTTQSNYERGIYGAYVDFQRMISKEGFKLLVYPKVEKVMLFNLVNDPLEMYDLAQQPEYRDRVRSLFEDLIILQKEMEDPLDLQDLYETI